MNTIIKRFASYLPLYLVLIGLSACEGNEMFDKEQYKKVVYLLSGDDLTYKFAHSLNTETSAGYISINLGGTKPADSDITVTVEKDLSVLDLYNHSNFDLDESKYAKELDPSRYTIKSYTVVLKVGSKEPYVRLPIEVRTEGLSPDSAYMIPLKMVDSSSFEMNPNKSTVLYRVLIENDFTSQGKPTVLFMRGTRITEGAAGKPTVMSGNKSLYPLAKRTVRMNVAMENSAGKLTEDLIARSSLIMEIKEETAATIDGNSYNPIELKPYNDKYVQIERIPMIDDDGQEISAKEANRYITELEVTRYYLSYRYRTLKTEAAGDAPAVWNDWVVAYENLKVSD